MDINLVEIQPVFEFVPELNASDAPLHELATPTASSFLTENEPRISIPSGK
jgi:hypothetical protein